ncbi:DUF262 domain-containing protein [Psychroserpens algicola]|uniref:DUF262 domain-containing protein n=1 Tax=Psychroserpens algicola TaxID=1719034 RepID=UPI0019538D1E|nr:DUF262 domain-containing protein [Psychroserpens algicola]
MLSANKEKLNSFFTGTAQYQIPYFQRSYVWNIDNWVQLWENLREELKAYQDENIENSEHFIGTIIVKQKNSERLGALEYDLIDGQQRLTTICLVLRSIHDATKDDKLSKYIKSLLSFQDSYGEDNIRVVHSKIDKQYFQEILLSLDSNSSLNEHFQEENSNFEKFNNIEGSYLFFKSKIEEELEEKDLRDLVNVVLSKLPVIHMALSKDDDVQQIFDTINSLGVKLTTAELLKNHLFAFEAVQPYYKEYWEDIFEADEDAISFWSRERTAGRNRRSAVELFLYSYLVIKTAGVIRIDSLFKEYKSYLKNLSDKEKIAFSKDLSEYAVIYALFPDGENLSQMSYSENEKRFMHILRELEISTAFPLILFIYKEVTDIKERISILKFLESYLVRRTICRLTTKNYNNLFISLLRELKSKDSITLSVLRDKVMSYDDDSSRFPNNQTLEHALNNKYLINKFSREVLYCIALYHLNNDFQDTNKLSFDGFSVEHIMPKKWRNNWSNPVGLSDEERDYKLLTLGNLTLLQGKLNSSLRDANWTIKKGALQTYSTLRITTDYLNNDEWNESIITARTNDLYKDIIKIWND